MENNENIGFTDLAIRETKDIEVLRCHYERLLAAYKSEVKNSVLLAIENERLQEKL